jgi:hypothetical protein
VILAAAAFHFLIPTREAQLAGATRPGSEVMKDGDEGEVLPQAGRGQAWAEDHYRTAVQTVYAQASAEEVLAAR